ncbi:MAG: TonB-dependent receptor [Oleispira sp.]|nr:TonB-dependent receptor [Oleispira sp.]MBL4880406.1 TonB-dependent receptor [Oleispira sp.]
MNKTTSRRGIPGHTAYLAALLLVPLVSVAEVTATEEIKDVANIESSNKESSKEKSVQLNTVVVKGQKIDREVQNTIAGISVATGEELARKGAVDLSAAFDEMSNVNIVAYGNSNEFAIRGIQSGGAAGTGKGSLASVLVDGLPLVQPAINTNIPLWDVDQVVVIKGPVSTNVGQGGAAGSIFITSNKPEFNNSGSVRAGFATHNTQLYSAMGNVAISDSLALRVTAEQQKSDGEYTNVYLDDDRHNFRDNSAYKASLLFQPNYNFSALLTVGTDKSKTGSALSCSDAQGTANLSCDKGDFKAAQDIKPRFEDERIYSILDINATINSQWTVGSLTAWSKTDSSYDTDLDRLYPTHPDQAAFFDGPIASEYLPFQQKSEYRHISEELKFTYNHNGIVSATGVYLAQDTSTLNGRNASITDAALLGFPVPASTYYVPTTQVRDDSEDNTTSFAVFNETDFSLANDLTLTLGLRYNQEQREYKSGTTNIREKDLSAADVVAGYPLGTTNGLVDAALAGISQGADVDKDKTFTEWLPKLGLSWNATEAMTFGYTFSQGYRSGGSNLNPVRGEVYDYDEEVLSNHELAFRSVWLENRLVVNSNIFYLDWDNQQVTENETGIPFDEQITNAGSSTSQGVELDVLYQADNGFNTSLNAGYADTEFKKFVSGTNDYSGNHFPYSPDLNASAGIGYDRGEGFNAKWRTQYTGESYAKLDNENKTKGYFLSHITVGYRQASWQIDTYVNNLFDHDQVIYDYEWEKPYGNVVTLVPGRVVGMIGQYNF